MITKSIDLTPREFMQRLPEREIVVTRSHGNHFLDDNGESIGNYIVMKEGSVYNSNIEDLEAGALSNVKLVTYVGCHTASGGVGDKNARNLVVASTNKGAMTAVGFTEEIACNGANTWTKCFFKYLAEGKNIDKAANNAVAETEKLHSVLNFLGILGIDSMLYRGAWDYTFVD